VSPGIQPDPLTSARKGGREEYLPAARYRALLVPPPRSAPTPALAAARLPQGWSTASISSWIVILSLTTAPPVSMTAPKFTPKSRRLISPMAVKPARVPP